MKKLLALLILVLLPTNVSAWQPVEDTSKWSCYDYSFDYKQNNPEWGCVSISNNQYFKGVSHMVNYKVNGENLEIHDGLYDIDYTINDWKNSNQFYHFWHTEPIRNYKFLRANNP